MVGTLRPSNDCYCETVAEDLTSRFDHQLQWPEQVRGHPILLDHMPNCAEDGIRAPKGIGKMRGENCMVETMRGGIKLSMAKGAYASHCGVMDCVIQGYSLPSYEIIKESGGNAAYGPLLYIHSDRHKDQDIALLVLPSSHNLGDHPLAALKGRGHNIPLCPSRKGPKAKSTERGNVAEASDSPPEETTRPIIIGYAMRFDFLGCDYPEVPEGHESHFRQHAPETYAPTDISFVNQTEHPVVLGNLSESNSTRSVGPIHDLGTSNQVMEEVIADGKRSCGWL